MKYMYYCLTEEYYIKYHILNMLKKYHILNMLKKKMWHQPARCEKSRPPFCQIWIIFTHLKLWIASARHNFKWVKTKIDQFGG